ncbi:PIN domain-containing protein [Paenibacillus sp. P26]|nr:PIN domain-containing protein [Paenibacillus sp. P26]UUZ92501.1 PIN domain-containing protein [Paenibacillus sp. P25]
MSKGYLLDTNIAIAILASEDRVIDFARKASNNKMALYFSTITLCEVFTGLKQEEQLRAEKLFTSKRCIDVTSDIARMAADIRKDQRASGRKLKTPDAIIIATALVNDLALVSRDSDMNFVQDELGIHLHRLNQ